MATRRDIKIAIRDEILTAVGSAVPPERILYTSQETRDVAYPRIIYTQIDVPTDKYGTRPPPYKHLYDVDGNKKTAVYAAFYTAFTDISIQGESVDTDTLFEDIRTQWEQYDIGFTPEETIHDDVTDVTIADASGEPNTDVEPTAFGTMVSLELEYRRDVTRDGVPIEQIHQNYDIDDDANPDTIGDGTTDASYTTS